MDALPRIESVSATGAPWTLELIWADGANDRVDLTDLIHRSHHFQSFLDDPAAFGCVQVADFGGGIEWQNGLDYGADTLKLLADEQRR